MNNNKLLRDIIKVLNLIDEKDFRTVKVRFVNNKLDTQGQKYATYENNFVAKFNVTKRRRIKKVKRFRSLP
jgi:hypothetical protein